jgi:hypothetical protein
MSYGTCKRFPPWVYQGPKLYYIVTGRSFIANELENTDESNVSELKETQESLVDNLKH